jgi:hypothetical protein
MTDLPVAVGSRFEETAASPPAESVLELLQEAFSRSCLRKQADRIVPIGDQRRNARNRRWQAAACTSELR